MIKLPDDMGEKGEKIDANSKPSQSQFLLVCFCLFGCFGIFYFQTPSYLEILQQNKTKN